MSRPLSGVGVLPRDDGTDQFLKLIQSPFNTLLSEKAFWSSFGYSFGAALLFALLFCILRPYNRTVYAPRLKHADEKHAPPPVDKGVFSWVAPVVKTREQVLAEKIGVDATLFLRFIKMSRNLMVVLSVVGLGVYIPLNLTQNAKNNAVDHDNVFISLTPLGVWGSACWAHVIVSYTFDIIVCLFIWWNYRAVTRLRRQYLDSPEYQESLHSRTLMVTDIPLKYRTDAGVSQILDEADNVGDHSGIVARNVKGLPELIEEHDEAIRELESILAKYLKNPDKLPAKRPRCKTQKGDPCYTEVTKVDAIEYLISRIERLKADIVEARRSVDQQKTLSYGFASYRSIEEAHSVAFAAKRKHPQGATIRLAPKPSDLIWENLPLDRHRRRWGSFMNNFWVLVLTAVWTVPNALIAVFLANLSNLGSVWPAFQDQLTRNPRTWGAIQGILAPLVTTLFYLVLPVIFRRLSAYAGDYSRTARERHVTQKLYAFFIFNNLIVFSLFSTAWKYVAAVKEAEGDTDVWSAIVNSHPFGNLLTAFCDVSPFWLNYLLQRNFGAALDLSQLIKLTKGYITRKLFSPTPRERIELSAPQPFDYAAYYNNFLFYTTIALVFAPFQPLVLPVTAFYFALDTFTKSYLLLYIFVTKHESGGAFWRVLVNRLLFATLLANVVTTIFIVDRRESINQIILMAPLLLIIAGFKWYCRRTFDDNLDFYSKGSHSPEHGKLSMKPKNDRIAVRFGHPALYKKLMVPLVHERANHLLKEIIHDNSDTDFGEANHYSDTYRLQRLSTHQSGQANITGDATFEVVNESQINFEHFRDREEFREFGGDGELYGIPSDQSRPNTPSSSHYTRSVSNVSLPREDYEGATYPTGYHPPSTFRPESLRRQYSEISVEHAPITSRQAGQSDVNLLGDVAPLGKTTYDRSYT
ncbi:hypothetical protein EKO27_g7116 [Xylaria grammica]|uniref:CSC1/OSCA1-like 7TM region domain-containing protein n=1 Tax=Xylaria grammica TaxID=363999 RepID=A0A439D0P6_9PEZI|nr:hypothetical protein EKO27_g7116 [Xylaria grammica]